MTENLEIRAKISKTVQKVHTDLYCMDALVSPLVLLCVPNALSKPLLIQIFGQLCNNEVVGALVMEAKFRHWLGGGPGVESHGTPLFGMVIVGVLC
jgi:hypothetical protein